MSICFHRAPCPRRPEAPGERVLLHDIAAPQFPLDRVVEMAQEGEVWVAEVEIPREARTLFFHVSGEEEPNFREAWGEDGEVYLMDADGSNPVSLTDNPAEDSNPVWSPDGREVFFWSDRESVGDIFVMEADGSYVRRLTQGIGWDVSISVSLDGSLIAFTSSMRGNPDIYLLDVASGQVIDVTNGDPEVESGTRVVWAPR